MANQRFGLQANALVMMGFGLLLLLSRPAAAQEELWIKQFGTNQWEWYGELAADGLGGVYMAGMTRGSLGGANAGGGPTVDDIYLVRFSHTGEQIWMSQFGLPNTDRVAAIAANGTEGVFVGGYRPSDPNGPNPGEYGAFVANFDSDGNLVWLRQKTTPEFEFVTGVASDSKGGVFFAGYEDVELTPTGWRYDTFLGHYDSAGEQTWSMLLGSAKSTIARTIAPSVTGGFFVGGHTTDTLSGTFMGHSDAWLARYDAMGNQIWIEQFGTSGGDYVATIAPDGANGVFIVGNTTGSLGGPNAGLYDAFIAHYDGEGNQTWLRQWGTSFDEQAKGLASDGASGVYFSGTSNWSFHNGNGPNIFIGHYDDSGNQTWLHRFGEGREDRGRTLAPDGVGGVYLGGYTRGLLGAQSFGQFDAFIARFGDRSCYQADCDQSTGPGVLDILDFLCFQSAFMNGEEFACDCDTTTGPAACDVFDFLCFQNAFVSGCP